MEPYHLRRTDKSMSEPAEQWRLIRSQRVMTLAMCRDNEPYLVTVDYAYDEVENSFYFHCAATGKKLDVLAANPRVWGQVLEDRGYLAGECDHAYRSVHFEGAAERVLEAAEKERILGLMLAQLESDPEPVRRRLIKPSSLAEVTVVRLRVTAMTGKKGPSEG